MNWIPITDPVNFSSEDFLASPADLVSLLSHLSGSNNLRHSHRRRDHGLEMAALSVLLKNPGTTAPLPALAFPAHLAAPRRLGAGMVRRNSGLGVRAEAGDGPAHPQRRKNCECGQCKWCKDNARWNRIFNEKFADPAYYTQNAVRHDSSLAEVR
jgi:hypothetical protein